MAAFKRRHLFIVGCAAIFLAGLGAGGWAYNRAETRALSELTANALRCAVAFHGGELKALTGTRADLQNPAYAVVKERLVELRHVQEGVRFVYIFRPKPGTNGVVFLADSEPAESSEVSLPGDDFPEAPDSPGLQSILANGRPSTEGPLRDSFGMWVTAYAPVQNPGLARPDIIGLDIEAGTWRANLFEQGFRAALYVWLLFGLPLLMQALIRRWSAQERTIRTLSEAMEQSRSALLIMGVDGRIQYVNRGLCEQLGYDRGELVGRNWADFGTDETRPEAFVELMAAVKAGRAWDGSWYNRRKAGERYPVNGVVNPVLDRKGRILCHVAALHDMTEAKQVEDELRTAKERAESGERAKGEFLDTMSHELRTPLNGIVGFISLLLDTPLTSEQREYVQIVRSSGEVLLRLTGDILDYSRMELNPPPMEAKRCEVRAVIESVLGLLSCMAAEKGIVFLHDVAPEVPAVAMLDSGRLRQVLFNLVGNAIKFTAVGEVEVRVVARLGRGADETGMWLDFTVRDTGPGISEADQQRLFRPFTQLDASINRRHGGTGLGLAISRSLVQFMGGAISLRSEVGKGSVFGFSVPVIPVEAQVASRVLAGSRVGLVVDAPGLLEELSRVIAGAGGVPVACQLDDLATDESLDLAVIDCDQGVLTQVMAAAVDLTHWPEGTVVGLVTTAQTTDDRKQLREVFKTLLSKPVSHGSLVAMLAAGADADRVPVARPQFDLRVLIVDDNAVNLRLLQKIVTVLGCRSVTVSGGREALDILANETPFDLVMLDLRMPEVDGMEVVRRVRSGEAGETVRGIWITIVTADTQTDAREDLFALGCSDFVAKPITLASCVDALRRVQANDGQRAQ